jgi:hypothetical protein
MVLQTDFTTERSFVMEPRKEDQKTAKTHSHAKKSRFCIQKLEERIAPWVSPNLKINPHGKWVGHGNAGGNR